ncbi:MULTISPECIES: hypothetical protein [Gordonibacter]|uniref:HEPN domain-containing protein n=1 Tax=Gordonibacter faecis TaxID=3047475 RepID=A0ABT7DMZ2_9ACTN|nr:MULTISPECIES: hypothetical protein [unclassified Gordonibacter]MDJ1650904.1 hypothetical protein [Gordonibacter sp. KGMB12511]HIW77435.1 hypothetical protein [Candidatus Gordonibacter avicola]
MATTYESSFELMRKARSLMDEAATSGAGEADGQVRMAFYLLYRAASLAVMVSPPAVKEAAERGPELSLLTDTLMRRYYRGEGAPRDPAAALAEFERWSETVARFVNSLAAQAKLSVREPKRR